MQVCGSPFEIESDPHTGSRFIQWLEQSAVFEEDQGIDQSHTGSWGKNMIYNKMALKAPDQLRQRVAWALAQIYVLGEEGAPGGTNDLEWYTTYYDIFVRHAFGNLRDLIQEVRQGQGQGKVGENSPSIG